MVSATLHDRMGLPLSTPSVAAADAYIEGIDRLMGFNADADLYLDRAIEADPGFAMAHAGRAGLLNFMAKPAEAKEAAARAREMVAGASRREQQHVEIVALGVDGQPQNSQALALAHLEEFPRDLRIVTQAIIAITADGAPRPKERIRELLARLQPHIGDEWPFLANLAMSYQEAFRFEDARRTAERAYTLRPRAATVVHPIAHVYYETGTHADGDAFLTPWLAEYETHSPYFSHLSWHLALFELAQGHIDRVMRLYDEAITPAVVESRISLVDASSLLWRCQMYGVGPSSLPWAAVQGLAQRLMPTAGFAFGDVHAALAYAGAGDDAAMGKLADELRALDEKGHPTAGSIVLPLVLGLSAFVHGAYAEAVAQIEPIMDELVRVGGSHAQREVFEDTLLEAYLRGGLFDRAESLLRARLDRRPSPRDAVWLSRAEADRAAAAVAAS